MAGSYGQGNTGDEAILTGLLASLRARMPECSPTVVSGTPEQTARRHAVTSVAWDDWVAILGAMKAADFMLLGGGGIFFDSSGADAARLLETGAPDLAHYGSYPLAAWLLRRPLVIHACGVGPITTDSGAEIVRAAFASALRSSVRDTDSLDVLRSIGSDTSGVFLGADPALVLEPAPETVGRRLVEVSGLAPRAPILAVTLRPWRWPRPEGEWLRSLAERIVAFARPRSLQVLLAPFDFTHDPAPLAAFREALVAAGLPAHASAIVPGQPLPEELASAFGLCHLVVGVRLHSVLLAALAGTPSVGISYEPKVRSHLAELGQPDLCLEPGDVGRVDALLEDVWKRREELKKGLARAVAGLRRRSSADADELARLLLSGATLPALPAPAHADLASLAGRSVVALVERLPPGGDAIAALREAHARRLESEARHFDETSSALQQQVVQIREQRDRILHERNDLHRRLTAIESTLAYAAASRIWKALLRLFPYGTRRRDVFYRALRAPFSRALRPRGSAGPLPESLHPLSEEPAEAQVVGEFVDFEARHRSTDTVVVILSATQLIRTEGQRPTHFAEELSTRGAAVVFAYWRWWSHEWCANDRMSEGLLQIPLDLLSRDPPALLRTFTEASVRVLLVEFPHPSFFELLAEANAQGWITVYDVLDDWEEFHRVGQAVWYDEAFERHLVLGADLVCCVNARLADRIRGLGATDPCVLGNGLRPGIARVGSPLPLRRGEVTVGYFGYLAGAWFDWRLVAEAARARPGWKWYLVGYGGSPSEVDLPENVELLGKRPADELAALAANWDVAVVPFKAGPLAAGADPIKTYEYLAMGLPVVTMGVSPPSGAEDLVTQASDLAGFLSAIEAHATSTPQQSEDRRRFAATCTWSERVAALLAAIARGEQRVAEKRALVGTVA